MAGDFGVDEVEELSDDELPESLLPESLLPESLLLPLVPVSLLVVLPDAPDVPVDEEVLSRLSFL
ncbi:MAG: hypothetical protein WD691_07925 [Acidimicrobiales bacterium]